MLRTLIVFRYYTRNYKDGVGHNQTHYFNHSQQKVKTISNKYRTETDIDNTEYHKISKVNTQMNLKKYIKLLSD